jgi:hypothetical protein
MALTPDQAARELQQLGRQLNGADKQITLDLRKALRAEVKPTISDIRSHARAILPNRGGLADLVAGAKYGARTSFVGKGAGVQIKGTGTRGKVRGLAGINGGTVRHPVHAHGPRKTWKWVGQSVTPDFFDGPIGDDLPKIRAGIEKAMDDTAKKLVEGVGT